jgi:hypothetical protein
MSEQIKAHYVRTSVNFGKVDVFHPEVFVQCIGQNVSVKTQPTDIRNIILHTKGYKFRLYLSHLQALKGHIHTITYHNWYTYDP